MCTSLTLILFILLLAIGVALPENKAANNGSTMYVNPTKGIHNKVCWSGQQPCSSLDLALQGAVKTTSKTSINIQPGEYNIVSVYDFYGKTGFELFVPEISIGHNELSLATISCQGNNSTSTTYGGFVFFYSNGIYFKNIKFVGCGAKRSSSSHDHHNHNQFLKFHAAIYLFFCTNVVMQNVSITQSNGTGLVLYNTAGQNRFTECNFTKNIPTKAFGGGGGVNIVFCCPGSTRSSFKVNGFISSTNYLSNASYLFNRCVFSDNVGKAMEKVFHYDFVMPASGNLRRFHSGGLSLLFKGVASNINVTILGSQFLNNTAGVGAGLEVLFEDSSSNNYVQVLSSHFINNHCPYEINSYQSTEGGGAYLHFGRLSQAVKHNRVVFNGTLFHNNSAYFGGGMSVYMPRETGEINPTNSILFTQSSWTSNIAWLGSAILMGLWREVTNGVTIQPMLLNCIFRNNSVEYSALSGDNVGIGTIYTDSVDLMFAGMLTVSDNYGSGIVSLDAGLEFTAGTVAAITSNTGRNGGAIALFGYAFIRVHDETVLEFVKNKVQFKGGAIYWESIGNHISSHSCFIRYNDVLVDPLDWHTHLTFKDNFAGFSGKAIYATTLLACLWGGNPFGTLDSLADQVFCWNNHSHIIWDYGNSNCSNSIATAGSSFINYISKEHTYNMSTIPRQHSTSPETNHCSPGYYFNHTTSECDFGKYLYIQRMGINASKIQRGCWIGYSGEANDTLVSGQCIYCASDPILPQIGPFIPLPQDPRELDETLCKPLNRTGVLCGRCVDGFAPAVNSKHFQCVNCTSGIQYYSWVLYILTEYVPITILLIIVILFNISVTSGPGNAFVFFAQVISSTFSINGDGTLKYQSVTSAAETIKQVYTSLYGIWNFNFFDSIPGWQYCLSPNLNSLQMRSLEYLTALYPLILLAIFLVFVVLNERHNKVVVWMLKPLQCIFARFRRRWNFKRSIVDAFVTFLILSFTKFAIISAYIIYPSPLYDVNGTVAYQTSFLYGDYAYLSKEHAPYLAVSVVTFIVVCCLMPLILLLYSLKPFYSCLTRLKLTCLLPGPRLQMFLNVFYNCYKDGTDGTHDLRCFASIYFGIRVLIVSLYSLATSWASQYMLQQIVCTVGVLLFAILQPYKSTFYNCVDATAFSILAVISIISFYNHYLTASSLQPSSPAYWLQIILIFFPMIFMSCYLMIYTWKATKDSLKQLFFYVCCCCQKRNSNWGLFSSHPFEQSFGSFMDRMVEVGEWRDTINYHGPVAQEEPQESMPAAANVLHTSVHLMELINDQKQNNTESFQMQKQESTCKESKYLPLLESSRSVAHCYGSVSRSAASNDAN